MFAGLGFWREQKEDVNEVAGFFPAGFVQQQVPVAVLIESLRRACLRKKSSVIISDTGRVEEQRNEELENEKLITELSSRPMRCHTAKDKGHTLFSLDNCLYLGVLK